MPSSKLIIVINISNQNGILAYDSELDSVVESVYGNRKDHYILVRGIADYKVSGQIDLDISIVTCFVTGRDAEEGVAALLRPDGRQRGQDHRGEHPQGVRGAVTC